MSAFAKHHAVSVRYSAKGVRRRVAAAIRFNFDYFANQQILANPTNEILAKNFLRDLKCGPEIKGTREWLQWSVYFLLEIEKLFPLLTGEG
jgi:hypothetical protein